MLTKTIVHSLAISTISYLSACGCKDSEMVKVLLSDEFKRYTDFPAGSWWSYEKIGNPNIVDSIYIYILIQSLLMMKRSALPLSI